MPPDKFIPIAEQYGLIINIGIWALQQSCIAAVNWQLLNYEPQPLASLNDPVLQLYDEISSLSVIQSLAANTLKIDRPFVNMQDTTDMVIIETVKHMTVKLNYDVVAQGVETKAQANKLSALDIKML
ncbi:hypothetical protein DBO93_05330 [Colwellia sp. Arc7-D]|nr:hypothetical protein DBO93_05330 [Colwellia sp. Arc7-D]